MKKQNKDVNANVQFKLSVNDTSILKHRMNAFGFSSYKSFYKFLTKNFILGNMKISMNSNPKWHISDKFAEELEKSENEPSYEITNAQKWADKL